MQDEITYKSRVFGFFSGLAVGDAVGYQVLGVPDDEIRSKYGVDGVDGPVPRKQGASVPAGDDTQMALFAAEAMVRVSVNGTFRPERLLEETRVALRDWLATQAPEHRHAWAARGKLAKDTVFHAARHPSSTSMSAILAGCTGTPDSPTNMSQSAAVLARCALIGLAPSISPRLAFDFAREACALTHGHPSAIVSSALLAALVREAVSGIHLHEALQGWYGALASTNGGQEVLQRVERAAWHAESTPFRDADVAIRSLVEGTGMTAVDALSVGIYAALVAPDFRTAIRLAANMRGACDSASCVAGLLVGVLQGVQSVPKDWLAPVDLSRHAWDMAGRFHADYSKAPAFAGR